MTTELRTDHATFKTLADELIAAMQANGAYIAGQAEMRRLEREIFTENRGPRTHGVINLYSNTRKKLPAETHRLWIAAGEHLGQALDKFIEDSEQKQLLIQNERNIIANELHDSLAQTLASLRFQVRVLDQALQPSGDFSTINSIEQVEHGLDEILEVIALAEDLHALAQA